MKKLSHGIIAVALLILLTACTGLGSSYSDRYDISYCSADNEPVWIEKVQFDRYPVKSGGGMMGGWMMAGGYILLFPPPPVPRQIYIYWFNYRQQVFYEATVHLKKDAAKTMFSLPKPRFGGPVLVTGVKPDGSAMVWVTNGGDAKFSTWVEVGRAQGTLAPGDPESRRNSTESLRRRGKL